MRVADSGASHAAGLAVTETVGFCLQLHLKTRGCNVF